MSVLYCTLFDQSSTAALTPFGVFVEHGMLGFKHTPRLYIAYRSHSNASFFISLQETFTHSYQYIELPCPTLMGYFKPCSKTNTRPLVQNAYCFPITHSFYEQIHTLLKNETPLKTRNTAVLKKDRPSKYLCALFLFEFFQEINIAFFNESCVEDHTPFQFIQRHLKPMQ